MCTILLHMQVARSSARCSASSTQERRLPQHPRGTSTPTYIMRKDTTHAKDHVRSVTHVIRKLHWQRLDA